MLEKLTQSEGAISDRAVERQPAIPDQHQSSGSKYRFGEAPPRHRLIDAMCFGQYSGFDDGEGVFHGSSPLHRRPHEAGEPFRAPHYAPILAHLAMIAGPGQNIKVDELGPPQRRQIAPNTPPHT